MKRSHFFYAMLSALIMAVMAGCNKDNTPEITDLEEEMPAMSPVYNHWTVEVNPYLYQNYCAAVVTLTKGKQTVDLSQYEVAAFNSKGECAGVAAGNKDATTVISIFGDEGDTYTFRLWDCVYAKERSVTSSFKFDTNAGAPEVNLVWAEKY